MYKILTILFTVLLCANSDEVTAQQLNIEYNHFIGADSCPTGPSDATIDHNTIVVTGYTSCSGKGNIPVNTAYLNGAIYVTKVDENHNIVWAKVFGGSNQDYSESIIKTSDDCYAVLGFSNSSDGDIPQNYGSNDIVLFKLDSNGNKIWARSYGSPADDKPISIIQTSDNGFLIFGAANGYGNDIPFHYTNSSFVYDWFLLKVDSLGIKEWCNVYGGSGHEITQGAVLEIDGYYYLTGSSESTDHDCTDTSWHSPTINTKEDIYLLKINTSGDIIWSKSYGGSGGDATKAAIWDDRDNTILLYGVTSSNDYMLEGLLHKKPNFPYITEDALIIKVDTSGKLLWLNTLGSTENEWGSKGIMKGPNGGYIVNSYASNQIGGQDDWIFILDIQGEIITSKIVGGKDIELPKLVIQYGSRYAIIGSTTSDSFFEGVNTPIGYSGHIYISAFHYFPTSIAEEDIAKNILEVYPNPTNDIINIVAPPGAGYSHLYIRSMDGRMVHREMLSENAVHKRDFSSYPNGVYILTVENKEGSRIQKLIKQ